MANEARASDAKLRVLTEVSQKDSRVALQVGSSVVSLDFLESLHSVTLLAATFDECSLFRHKSARGIHLYKWTKQMHLEIN